MNLLLLFHFGNLVLNELTSKETLYEAERIFLSPGMAAEYKN